jgi:3-hydroxymyristoyl/3-hydroxydecanoyl-(acyl carrier protein) dehydratase
MPSAELCRIIEGNQWVSSAVVLDSDSNGKTPQLQVEISPDGHRAISDFGFQEFTDKLLADLPSVDQQPNCLMFSHLHHWIFDRFQDAGENRQPGIFSLISELSQHRLLLDVGQDLVFFKGHFPGNPILPGIAQLHWAVGVTMSLFGFSEVPNEIKRLKFRKVVQPSTVLELWLKQCNKNEVQFQYESLGQIHSVGSLMFKDGLSC